MVNDEGLVDWEASSVVCDIFDQSKPLITSQQRYLILPSWFHMFLSPLPYNQIMSTAWSLYQQRQDGFRRRSLSRLLSACYVFIDNLHDLTQHNTHTGTTRQTMWCEASGTHVWVLWVREAARCHMSALTHSLCTPGLSHNIKCFYSNNTQKHSTFPVN